MFSCYIDPAATTVLISSLSAIVIAVGATAVVVWRRAKNKVANALHIDENAGKEVEEDLVLTDAETAETETAETETAEAETAEKEPAEVNK